MKIFPQNKTLIAVCLSIILFLLYIIILEPIVSNPSYLCSVFKDIEAYKQAYALFLVTENKRLGARIATYEESCLGDKKASEKTFSMVEEMRKKEKDLYLPRQTEIFGGE